MSRQQRNSRDEASFSKHADPLGKALQIQREAAALNFDWPDAHGALRKLLEEIEELEELLASETADPATGRAPEATESTTSRAEGAVRAIEEEVGDLLFAAINVCRLCDVPPGPALSNATEKFERRFGALLSRASQRGIDPRLVSLEELDLLWESVKREEQDQA
jgi:uncharacterized protein YabN with tetrapyrrole methylase and pyrophosphatase domain